MSNFHNNHYKTLTSDEALLRAARHSRRANKRTLAELDDESSDGFLRNDTLSEKKTNERRDKAAEQVRKKAHHDYLDQFTEQGKAKAARDKAEAEAEAEARKIYIRERDKALFPHTQLGRDQRERAKQAGFRDEEIDDSRK